MNVKKPLIFFLAIVVISSFNIPLKLVTGKMLTVGEGKQYLDINSAVNQSASGDVILVFSGIYYENISGIEEDEIKYIDNQLFVNQVNLITFILIVTLLLLLYYNYVLRKENSILRENKSKIIDELNKYILKSNELDRKYNIEIEKSIIYKDRYKKVIDEYEKEEREKEINSFMESKDSILNNIQIEKAEKIGKRKKELRGE